MDKYDNTTSVLSVSSKNGNLKDCLAITKLLEKIGIKASVISNRSVVCNAKLPCTCYMEYGCDIRLNGLKKNLIKSQVWNPLQEKFNFGCGYLNIPGHYSGCINAFRQDDDINDLVYRKK